jgi:hypothetical protein
MAIPAEVMLTPTEAAELLGAVPALRSQADIAASTGLPYFCLLFAARVFIDTNVLFPFSVMDLMLALTEDGIHDVMWSDDLLDEWERVIVRERRRFPDAAAAITATIRQFFADTRIPAESYQELIAQVDGPGPDDNMQRPTTARLFFPSPHP